MMTTASVDFDVQLPVGAPAPQGPVEPLADAAVESFNQAMEQPTPDAGTGSAAFGEAVQAFADAFAAEELPQAEVPATADGARKEPTATDGMRKEQAVTDVVQKEPVAPDRTEPVETTLRDDEDAGEAADRMVASGMAPQAPVVPSRPEAPDGPSAAGTIAADVAVEAVGRITKTASPADVMLQVAEEVADSILVSPGLLRGEGEIRIQLKPNVLDGSEVRISVQGRQLGVELLPVAADVAAFVERNLPQLQQLLAARVQAFTVGVSMRRNRVGRA